MNAVRPPHVRLEVKLVFVFLILTAMVASVAAAVPEVSPRSLRAAVERTLPLLERSSAFTLQERACFTCHHGAHPTMALNAAWSRGFRINRGNVDDQLERAYRELVNDVPRFREGYSVSKTADGPGHSLWMLDVSGWNADAVAAEAAEFFLKENSDLDHWEPPMNRPPTVGSPFTSTFLVLRALKLHGTPAQHERITRRTAAAMKWLHTAPGEDTEDNVYRLRALHLLSAGAKDLEDAAERLMRAQHADGGWAQLPHMESDAYATGTALAALLDTGMLTPADGAAVKGAAFLLGTQHADGSWFVRKRTRAVQPFFHSGFPHKEDQFIAVSASSWAAYALARMLPPDSRTRAALYLDARPAAQARLHSSDGAGAQPVKFTGEQLDFFRQKIEPVFAGRCYECHSAKAKKLKADLFVDTRGGLLTGGVSGPALKPGDPEHSLLIQALEGEKCEQMPPKEKLPATVIDDFKKWIEMGAPDPRAEKSGAE